MSDVLIVVALFVVVAQCLVWLADARLRHYRRKLAELLDRARDDA